jgi:plasmid stability protein
MAISLSIKNLPDDIAARLKARAARNHRSLQGEIIAILEDATAIRPGLSVREALEEGRRDGLSTPSEAAEIVRHGRDAR